MPLERGAHPHAHSGTAFVIPSGCETVSGDGSDQAYNLSVTSSDGGLASTGGTLPLSTGVNAIAFGNFNTRVKQNVHLDKVKTGAAPRIERRSLCGTETGRMTRQS